MENNLIILSWSGVNSKTGSGTVVADLLKFCNNAIFITEDAKIDELQISNFRILYFKNIFRKIPRFHHVLGIFLVPFLLRKLFKVVKNEKVNKVLVLFPDELYLISGYLISKFLKLDLFLYYHNSYSFNRKYISKIISHYFESRILLYASHVFFISDGLRNVYAYYFPIIIDKCSVLEHTIYSQLRSEEQTVQSQYFLFTGSINQTNIDSLLIAFEFILSSTDYIINVAGPNGYYLNKYLTHDRLNILGFLSDSDLLDYQNGSVANIIVHGGIMDISYIENQTILPTRFMKQLGVMNHIIVIGQKYTYLHFFASKFNNVYFVDLLNIREELPQVIDFCISNEVIVHRDTKLYSFNELKMKFLSVLRADKV